MSVYQRSGKYKGIDYVVIETDTIYNIKNEEEHKIILDHLNSQIGYEHFKMDKVSYPYYIYLETEEMLELETKIQIVKGDKQPLKDVIAEATGKTDKEYNDKSETHIEKCNGLEM